MIRLFTLSFWISCFSLLVLPACEDDNAMKWQKEMDALDQYVKDHNITTKPTYSGLYYIETTPGDGKQPKYGSMVFVNYKGYFLDGTVFDKSTTDPLSFQVGYGQVIRGWDEAMLYMKERGKAQLIVPSTLAYGAYGSYGIPPYTTLIFDVELVQVQ